MNIYGSLMDIYDEKNTDIQDNKKTDIQDEKNTNIQDDKKTKDFILTPPFPRQTAQFDR